MQWVNAEIAPGTVAKLKPGKLFLASSVAKPEFCIPTSIDIVWEFFLLKLSHFDKRYPRINPSACRVTITITRVGPVEIISSFLAARIKSTMNTIDMTAMKGV